MKNNVQICKVKGYEWVADNLFYSVREERVYEPYDDGKWYLMPDARGVILLNRADDEESVPVGMKSLVSACVDYARDEQKTIGKDVKVNTLGGFQWVSESYYFSMTEEKVYYTNESGKRVYPVVMSHGMVYVLAGNNGRMYPVSVGVIMKALGMTQKPVETREEVPPNRGFIIGKLVNGVIRIARNPKTHQDEESCDKELERLASINPEVFFVKLAIRDVVVGKEETKVTVTRL